MTGSPGEGASRSLGEQVVGQTIAGVTVPHISDNPPNPYFSSQEPNGHLTVLERKYNTATSRFIEVGYHPAFRGHMDGRIYDMTLMDETKYVAPRYTFMISRELIEKVREGQIKQGRDLSQDELFMLALTDHENAVAPDFSADAMNAVNVSYYSSPVAFDPSARLATLFLENRPLNVALGGLIAENTGEPGSTHRRIKELGSGNRTGHWSHIAEGLTGHGVTSVELVLTDFQAPDIEAGLSATGLQVSVEQYSLIDDLPRLPEEDRFDALVATYAFDSVWQPEDVSLEQVGEQWYKRLYRVKVADWAPRRDDLVSAMRRGEPLPEAMAIDYDGIFVETVMEPIDISAHPFAQYITESEKKAINFPGGLIKRVVNAFETQLNEHGVFVIGDTGEFAFEDLYRGWESDQSISGIAARYKIEDYVLAKQILEEEYGFSVSLLPLQEVGDTYLPDGWLDDSSPLEKEQMTDRPMNGVMLVKRR